MAQHVTAISTDYAGRWPRHYTIKRFFHEWLWNWEIAKPYVLWTAYGLIIEIGAILGYWLGMVLPLC